MKREPVQSSHEAPAILHAFLEQETALRKDIGVVFQQMRSLKNMRAGQDYTLPVNGETIQGPKEAFLRRRTCGEIQASGLSSGCGDHAIVFSGLIAERGYPALLVDSAALSTISLASHFAGHAVVAVDKGNGCDWCLVDPTNRTILEDHWSPNAKSFRSFGRMFWIGYCRPVAHYPVHDGASLQAFYTQTLESVPRDVFNANLFRLTFTVDDSLKEEGGRYVNPCLVDFLQRQSEVFARYGISPRTDVAVRLIAGDDDALSSITRTETGQWTATVGRRSGCTDSLLDYFERAIANELQS